jgi:hypothetical protein
MSSTPADVNVERLMQAIEDEVRRERRGRIVARGGPDEYRDAALYELVERALRRAAERHDLDTRPLLLPELAGDKEDTRLQTHVRFASHRPITGGLVIFAKRHLLLPLTRWLYQYAVENFKRQERVNRLLFACLEELAIENAKLRLEIAARQDHRTADRDRAGQ